MSTVKPNGRDLTRVAISINRGRGAKGRDFFESGGQRCSRGGHGDLGYRFFSVVFQTRGLFDVRHRSKRGIAFRQVWKKAYFHAKAEARFVGTGGGDQAQPALIADRSKKTKGGLYRDGRLRRGQGKEYNRKFKKRKNRPGRESQQQIERIAGQAMPGKV